MNTPIFLSIIFFLVAINFVNAQYREPTETTGITGNWGMYKDKHPDGWGKFEPPYYYLILNEDGTYQKAYFLKKDQTVIFGTYELQTDSLLVFNESIGTNGTNKGKVVSDTVKFIGIQDNVLKINSHWHGWLSKKVKRWKHRMEFRPLEPLELVELKNKISSMLDKYSQLDETEFGG